MTWNTSVQTPYVTSPAGSGKHQLRYSKEDIKKTIYRNFLAKMEYRKPDVHSTNEVLEAWMRDEMYAQGIQCPELEEKIHLAASLIELAFHECTLPEKRS